MTDFTFHTEDSAPEASKPFLTAAKRAYRFIPNLQAGMAEAPALLEGYMALAGILDKTGLSDTERQIILMTNNRLNGCTYCMATHTTISQAAKIQTDVIEALRKGTVIPDPKLEALRQFAIVMNERRGWVNQDNLDKLFTAGYTKQTVLEVILGTSLKIMSNYTNHVAKTPVDAVFQANTWLPPTASQRKMFHPVTT
ncbi:carboxymuconolactone decarboxylase family protein [Nitrosomonas aestuarii]|uniref:carboxymuconolactone decarboxylase family protein n=1 Tax=Nitrosomonas aestuarii TaxID=52441 RepID=UPI000D312FD4|nr:carboxymuconolactone decarboxylase family protein [Nitrosomonas aestuarii]PTN13214.1 putative peroxidase-related enzyme [Nitrosomonas aestuarii]